MNENFKLTVIRNLGALNTSLQKLGSFRIFTDSDFNTNGILYWFYLGTRRIICLKFNLDQFINKIDFTDEVPGKLCKSPNLTTISYSKVLNLPVEVNHFISNKQNLWAVSSESCLDLKFHLEKLFQESFYMNSKDGSMNVSTEDEFNLSDFELVIEKDYLLKFNVPANSVCFNCNFNQKGFGICYEDAKENSWNVMLIMPNIVSSMNVETLKYIPLFTFPFSFHQSNSILKDTTKNYPKPVVIFFESNHKIWNTLFRRQQQTTSNYICLIGHPEGKLLYCVCTWLTQKFEFRLLTEIQQLYDVNQTILNIHYCERIAGIEGEDFLIIVGEMGKLILVSSHSISAESSCIHLTIGSLWFTHLQLPVPIKNYIILNGCILYSSKKGDLWISKFSVNKSRKNSAKKCLELLNEATHFCEIMRLLIINDTKGLFLMVTSIGTMYLMQYINRKKRVTGITLPIVMNGLLKESSVLKELSSVKEMLSKLFISISTLAKLKFRDYKEIHIECLLREVDGPPKKFLLDLNLKNIEQLNLYPKFWFITASLYCHFQKDSAIVSRSKLLDSDHNLSIEVLESVICQPFTSPFPLFLEIGLILCLPKELENVNCFKPLTTKLPFYIRTHIFTLNELNLLKSKEETHKLQLFASDADDKNIFQRISDCNLRYPIYKLLDNKCSKGNLSYVCNEFTLCLLESHAKNLSTHFNKGSNLVPSILQILGHKSYLQIIDGNKLVCRGKPIILSVTSCGNVIHITVSSKYINLLLGLRMAIAELLLNNQDNSRSISNCIKIPASLLKKCEVLSETFLDMHGTDVTASDFLGNVLKKYQKLRNEISQNVPF